MTNAETLIKRVALQNFNIKLIPTGFSYKILFYFSEVLFDFPGISTVAYVGSSFLISHGALCDLLMVH